MKMFKTKVILGLSVLLASGFAYAVNHGQLWADYKQLKQQLNNTVEQWEQYTLTDEECTAILREIRDKAAQNSRNADSQLLTKWYHQWAVLRRMAENELQDMLVQDRSD